MATKPKPAGVRHTIGLACATTVVGIPLALAALIWGGKLLVLILTHLPQN